MSHRTQITLTDRHYERLRSEAARSGLSLAELVRRAIEQSYGAADHTQMLDVLEGSFGAWAHQEEDGAAFVDDLRRGMARRLADA